VSRPVCARARSQAPQWPAWDAGNSGSSRSLSAFYAAHSQSGTAIHDGGQFGHLSHSLDSTGESLYPCFSRSSPFSPFQAARIVMPFPVYVFLFVIFLILCLALLWCLSWLHRQPSRSRGRFIRSTTQRLLKPQTPLDCPACRLSCPNEQCAY